MSLTNSFLDNSHLWTWDVWFPTGINGLCDPSHMFHLQAPRSLKPNERHWRSTVGHAVLNGNRWARSDTSALTPDELGNFDSTGIWTGGMTSLPPGYEFPEIMLYTGVQRTNRPTQNIGLAHTKDIGLHRWSKFRFPVIVPSAPYCSESVPEPIFRDPFPFFGPDNELYVAFAARLANAPYPYNACIGLAVANDTSLTQWQLLPPLVDGTGKFKEMEVPQVVNFEGKWYTFFTVHDTHYSQDWLRKAGFASNGLHCYVSSRLFAESAPANQGHGGVWDEKFTRGLRLLSRHPYKEGPIIPGKFPALGWNDGERDGDFKGGISDVFTVIISDDTVSVVREK